MGSYERNSEDPDEPSADALTGAILLAKGIDAIITLNENFIKLFSKR